METSDYHEHEDQRRPNLPDRPNPPNVDRLESMLAYLMETVQKQQDQISQLLERAPVPPRRNRMDIIDTPPPSAGTTIDLQPDTQDRSARPSRDPYTPMREAGLAPVRPNPLPPGTKEPKVAEPPRFDGTTSKLEEFITKLVLVFRLQANRHPDATAQINYAIGFLEGRAFKTVSAHLRLSEQDQPLFLHDFDAFVQFLRDNFGYADEKRVAAREIKRLKQTGSASEYFAEFGQYVPLVNFNSEALVEMARDGLKEDVIDELMRLDVDTSDFNRFRAKAIEIDNRNYERRLYRKEKRGSKSDSKEANPPRHDRILNDRTERTRTVEKEVTRVSPSGTYQKGPISDEERQRRRGLGLCTYCGKAGHYASACPLLAQKDKSTPPTLERARNASFIIDNSPASREFKANRTEWVKFRFHGKDPLIDVDLHANNEIFKSQALIDTGATVNFIRPSAEVLQHVEAIPYDRPKRLRLVDDQPNPDKRGEITHYVTLSVYVDGRIGPYPLDFDIADIASPDIVLGYGFVHGLSSIINFSTCEISLDPPDTPLKGANSVNIERNRYLRRVDPIEEPDPVDTKALQELGQEQDEDEEFDIAQEEMRQLIPQEFHDYLDIFRKSDYTSLPPHRSYDHVVELLPNVELKRLKPYPLSAAADKWLKNWIDESRRIGHIEPSSHWFGSPVFLVPKKTPGEFRMVTDFRALNNATKKNAYPLPRINTTLERVSRARVFSKFDMPTSYQLLRMREEDEDWTTILTRYGSFKSRVMREGMTNAGASFQFFMNDVFNPLLDQGVTVYIDDILVYTETMEEHVRLVKEVFNRIREFELYLKPKKCEFFKTSIEFLGYIIKDGAIAMAPNKLESIRTWPQPNCVKEIQRFLGFTNYYRRFIKGYAGITLPIIKLTKKSEPWKWGAEQDRAFKQLISAFASEPVLLQANSDKTSYLETDASDYAIAAVLSQRGPDDELHPIGFFSRKLNPAEINYTVHDKELLAIIEGFNHWKPILLGMSEPIEVLTDHKNLEYFATNKQLNRRQIRWAETLADFNFHIRYRPGSRGGKPDSLTRRPDYHPGRGGINSFEHNQPNFTTLLPKDLWTNDTEDTEFFRRAEIDRFTSDESNPQEADANLKKGGDGIGDIANDIISLTKNIALSDEFACPAFMAIWKPADQNKNEFVTGSESATDEQLWTWSKNGILRYNNKIYVPDNEDIKLAILRARHDALLAGHPGRERTLELVSRDYYWNGLSAFVKAYVASCEVCQRDRTNRHKPYGFLKSLSVPFQPNSDLSMDHVEELPDSEGFNSILVITDRFTKRVKFVPTTTTSTAKDLAKIFLKEVFTQFGLPDRIVSDRGSKFTSKFWQEFTAILGISSDLTTAYRPQSDGSTERVNQSLESYLRHYSSYHQDDWANLLPLAEFVHNNATHSATGVTPFMATFGYNPRFDINLDYHRAESTVARIRAQDLKQVWEQMRIQITLANERAAKYFDNKHQAPPDIIAGSKVYISSKFIATKRPMKKLDHKRYGPYEVIEAISSHAYRIRLPASLKIHNVFHIDMLELHQDDPFLSRAQAPGPIVESPYDDEYEIDEIIDSRIRRKRFEYLIKWKGYSGPEGQDWTSLEDLGNADEAQEEFHTKFPDKPTPPGWRV